MWLLLRGKETVMKSYVTYPVRMKNDEIEYIKNTLKMLPLHFIHEAIQKHLTDKLKPIKKERDVVLRPHKHEAVITPIFRGVFTTTTLHLTEEQERQIELEEQE